MMTPVVYVRRTAGLHALLIHNPHTLHQHHTGESSEMFLHLFIISRSGGLIYNKDLSISAPRLTVNEWLVLGSTFHGLHSIAAQVAPLSSSGIEKLECDNLKLQCFQSRTGVKFVLTAEPGTPDLDNVLHGIYELYADYVLKNPFYEMDMPIRCELFQQGVERLIERNSRELKKARSDA